MVNSSITLHLSGEILTVLQVRSNFWMFGMMPTRLSCVIHAQRTGTGFVRKIELTGSWADYTNFSTGPWVWKPEIRRFLLSTLCPLSGPGCKSSLATFKVLLNYTYCVGFLLVLVNRSLDILTDYNLWREHSGLPEVYDTKFRQATAHQYPLRPGKFVSKKK